MERHQHHAAVPLEDNCILVARDLTMRSCAKAAGETGQEPARADGLTLGLHHVAGPDDVHYPVWEMHPEGDELLLVASGSLSVEWRDGAVERTTRLLPQSAFVVPAGVWHRLVVHEKSTLVALTPRRNTAHARTPDT